MGRPNTTGLPSGNDAMSMNKNPQDDPTFVEGEDQQSLQSSQGLSGMMGPGQLNIGGNLMSQNQQ